MNTEKTIFQFEATDTFGGEANYSWAQRAIFEMDASVSDKTLVRRAKKWAGINGVKSRVENYGDMLAIYPQGICQVIFVSAID